MCRRSMGGQAAAPQRPLADAQLRRIRRERTTLNEIYLDNSATTQVDDRVIERITEVMRQTYGNPSSLYDMGLAAQLQLQKAAAQVAELIGGDKNGVYFTSGGTESNNWAVFGTAWAKQKRGRRIVTTAFEHSSVLASCARLEQQGFEVIYVQPDQQGNITAQDILSQVNAQTILVSFMLVNNEVGTVLPFAEIAKGVKAIAPNATVHCDAVQAFGKLPLRIDRTDIDLLSMSGHKIHAPKGIGALYIKKGTRIDPLLYGGAQQGGMRPGTESLPLACGMGLAAQLRSACIREDYRTVTALRDYTVQRLRALEGIQFNSPEDAFPYILNLSVPGIRSETMLHHLERMGIYVSSASACTKGAASHVLASMGLSHQRIDSALRVSFNARITTADIDRFIEGLQLGMQTLARRR